MPPPALPKAQRKRQVVAIKEEEKKDARDADPLLNGTKVDNTRCFECESPYLVEKIEGIIC